MAKEHNSVTYNSAYGELIFTVRTVITLTKRRMLFLSIQNAFTINTVFQEAAEMIL